MIKISHVTKKYGKEIIVDDLSLSIKEGTIFGFLGPNGAGKTTTLKIILSLIKDYDGIITIGGEMTMDAKTKEKIGFMPEDPYFYDHLTGLEFLKFCGELFNYSREKNNGYYLNILDQVGLYDARSMMVRNYSKGMKQRLGLAQALVNDPDYIFLDEPLDGLDPIGRADIKNIIKGLKKRKKTVFFSSHILSDIEELCDEIGIINKGKLLYSGSVKKFCRGSAFEEKFVEVIKNEKRTGNR
ncbi:MAG: ABC transporter ATP-binding protein [Patescibacteria group bacterium]|jgi:ABC-2 type transport system ATP-binding protein